MNYLFNADARQLESYLNGQAARNVITSAFTESFAKWRILDLVGTDLFDVIEFNDNLHEYTPEVKTTHGKLRPLNCDAKNITKQLTPDPQPINVVAKKLHDNLSICLANCKVKNQDDFNKKILFKQAKEIFDAGGDNAIDVFFNGIPELQIYGMANNPYTTLDQAKTASVDGSNAPASYASATATSMVKEWINLAYGMRQPRFVLSSKAYLDAFGKETECNGCPSDTPLQRVTKIMGDITSQLNFDFNTFRYTEWLDAGIHQVPTLLDSTNTAVDVSNQNLMFVYDAAYVSFKHSNPFYFGALASSDTRVDKKIAFNMFGLINEKAKSVRIRWGI